MKILTALLVGAAMLLSSLAGAQYFAQASVSGVVLSEGPRGFMLQGPDGNYGIAVTPTTVVTDPWNTFVATGPGMVAPGEFVTATGYPTSQWIMQATQVVVRNGNPPVVSGIFGTPVVSGAGIIRTPNMFAPIQQGGVTFNTLPTPLNNTFNTLPTPMSNPFSTLPSRFPTFNPFGMRAISR
jgi:hypothetical protein